MPVAGVGEVDRAQIAQQMAAALIAQGKTNVSSEELAQLVDAVVCYVLTASCAVILVISCVSIVILWRAMSSTYKIVFERGPRGRC